MRLREGVFASVASSTVHKPNPVTPQDSQRSRWHNSSVPQVTCHDPDRPDEDTRRTLVRAEVLAAFESDLLPKVDGPGNKKSQAGKDQGSQAV